MDKLDGVVDTSVIKAIPALDYKVTPAAIALHTGKSIEEAEKALNALFSVCGEGFEITGETTQDQVVVYIFPTDFQTRLTQRSRMAQLEHFYQQWKGWAFALIRTCFGAFLLLSLAIIAIVAAVIAIYAQGNQQGGSGGNFTNLFSGRGRRHLDAGDIYLILWIWRDNPFFAPIPQYQQNYRQQAQHYRWRQQINAQRPATRRYVVRGGNGAYEPAPVTLSAAIPIVESESIQDESIPLAEPVPEMSFLQSIFSFVFGDGPPGPFEDDRWKIIAAIIKKYKGIVPSEVLAPFMGHTFLESEESEAFMRPVIARFDGRPIPMEESNLVYFFRQFSTAHVTSDTAIAIDILSEEMSLDLASLPYFHENEHVFSYASSGRLQVVALLGLLNLLGVFWLRKQLRSPWKLHLESSSGLLLLLHYVTFLLLMYSISFFAIPALRYGWIVYANKGILRRNTQRQYHEDQLQNLLLDPTSLLSKKLEFTQNYLRTA